MRPEDDGNGYVYSDIPWRYSGLNARFLGLDPLVILLIPIGILGLRQGWGWLFLAVIVLLLGLFVWVAFKGYPSLRVFLRSVSIVVFGRGRWKTR